MVALKKGTVKMDAKSASLRLQHGFRVVLRSFVSLCRYTEKLIKLPNSNKWRQLSVFSLPTETQ